VSYAGTKEETNMQTEKAGRTGRRLLRAVAAAILVGMYCLSTAGIVMTSGITSAQARGRGGGRGGGRGFGRGFGGGFGVYYGGDRCWWSRRYRRRICPNYY
jgi:hypothetical protein